MWNYDLKEIINDIEEAEKNVVDAIYNCHKIKHPQEIRSIIRRLMSSLSSLGIRKKELIKMMEI